MSAHSHGGKTKNMSGQASFSGFNVLKLGLYVIIIVYFLLFFQISIALFIVVILILAISFCSFVLLNLSLFMNCLSS